MLNKNIVCPFYMLAKNVIKTTMQLQNSSALNQSESVPTKQHRASRNYIVIYNYAIATI